MDRVLRAIDVFSARHNIIPKLPYGISWFLGYRKNGPRPVPDWQKLLSILLVTMAGMLPNLAVVEHAPLFTNHWHFETFIPSFAATCILIYGSIDAPFSQPRNVFFGHFLSGLIGVCIMKLFMTNSHNEKYLWLGGALSVACSSVVMEITGTVHPPSGATAVLPSVNRQVQDLGWDYLPALIIHSLIFLGVALLCNNIARRYPRYWISPSSPPSPPPPAPQIVVTSDDIKIGKSIDVTEAELSVLKALQARLIEA